MDYAEYIRGSNGDGEAVRAVVTAPRDPGDMDLIVDSVLNWPNKFIATSGVLDPETGLFDPDTVCIFFGQLTGSIINIQEFAPGYFDDGHAIGMTLVLKPTTPWADAVAEAAESGGVGSGIIVSPTPPADPEEDDFWLDESTPGTAGSNSFIVGEIPVGTVDGTNDLFTVSDGSYIGGSLEVMVNGLAQRRGIDFFETSPTAGTFTLATPPTNDGNGDPLTVNYQHSVGSSDNADTLDGYQLTAIMEALYPIGAIFVSGSSTVPALVASIGTWTRIEGRFIVGASDTDGDFDNGDTGGAKSFNNEHDHLLPFGWDGNNDYAAATSSNGSPLFGSTVQTHHRATRSNGGFSDAGARLAFTKDKQSTSQSILPPYKAKYMWERTA